MLEEVRVDRDGREIVKSGASIRGSVCGHDRSSVSMFRLRRWWWVNVQ